MINNIDKFDLNKCIAHVVLTTNVYYVFGREDDTFRSRFSTFRTYSSDWLDFSVTREMIKNELETLERKLKKC